MSSRFQRITPFLWFDRQAEEATNFYVSVFENSRIVSTTRYNGESAAASGCPEGSLMTAVFELDGQQFVALDGGPMFQFNEAVSLVVNCHSQDEVDYYWDKLSQGGDEKAQQCGWLKDRYGLSWQVIPVEMIEMFSHPDRAKVGKMTDAMMKMKKIDLSLLREAMN
ncbi:VOC family protein [Dyella humicola]|uniref:VOC family protein n=1 Tax=Dyella humicola TaxID=2992126 RepID=UPI00225365B0|nr:VOC family protein [Dyella humicola]